VNERKPDATSALIHDLNNGLGAILGRCDLLLSLMPNHPDAKHVLGIREAAARMSERLCACQRSLPSPQSTVPNPSAREPRKTGVEPKHESA